VPLFFARIGIDPAVATNPIVTTTIPPPPCPLPAPAPAPPGIPPQGQTPCAAVDFGRGCEWVPFGEGVDFTGGGGVRGCYGVGQ
jgi:hypothetical protein